MKVRQIHSSYWIDDYWQIYLAQDVETAQEYDVRVASFGENDITSMNRLKHEIKSWVKTVEILLTCRN